ncbi:T9SS type A sorting domain-containing protein [Flavobacteriales bacterium]|nr:T9SS type A sorting domain-containing protein [Flavobacteriales bacterium]
MIGDQVIRYTDTIPAYGPGGSGANQVWDFSGAIDDVTATTDVVSVASTPYSSNFGSSDYAMTGAADSYLYFTHNNVYMGTDGAAGDLLETGEIIEAPFTDPLVLHTFPRTYNSRFDDIYSFVAEADGAAFDVYRIRLTHTGQVFDTTDAYGTLITPTGTYDALRVKTVDFTTDNIEAVLTPPLIPGFPLIWIPVTTVMDTTVTYSWHAKEQKLAIAEFAFDSIGNPARFTYSAVPPVSTVGIDDMTSEAIVIYPQPATNQICLSGLDEKSNHIADVFTISGKQIRQNLQLTDCLDVSDLAPGVYLLSLKDVKGTFRETLKFVVR